MAENNNYRNTIQSERLLTLLRSAHGAWVPLPEILALGIAQYNTRIFELRKRGLNIENKTETVDGVRHSWFRMATRPPGAAPEPEPAKLAAEWKDRPRLTGLPLFDLGAHR